MKTKHIVIALALMLAFPLTAPAENMHTGQSMGMSHSMDMPVDMDHSAQNNKATIRGTMVDNYHLVYDLYVMRGKMEQMPGMESSHHLMVTIHSPEGTAVHNATVGYLITGPDDEKQKAMAMAMGDGYGANINLDKTGTYTISVKAVFGDTDLRDSFTYAVK